MTDVRIGDATLRVEVEGDPARPALVLSNALGTDLAIWDAQMPALLKHFRVIRTDTRGHGGSVAAPAPYSIATLGRDVLAILDALDIAKASFMGISMGGAVGQWLLVHAPERIEKAVLACTAALLGTPESWNTRIASVLDVGMAPTAEATIERWFSPAFRKSAPMRVEAVHAMLIGTSPQGYAGCCAALRDMDLRQSLHGVAHPVLVVTGADDPVASEDDANVLVDALANATHVILDAKHMAIVEADTAFTAAIMKFLTAKTRTPRAKALPRATPRKAATRKSAGRVSTARVPLTKAAPKSKKKLSARKTVAAASRPAATAARRPAKAGRARVASKAPPAKVGKSASAKSAPVKSVPAKTVPAKTAKTPAKKKAAPAKPAAGTRRKTKTAAARGAVKKAPAKKVVAKAAPKKAAAKKPAKRPPAPRRRSTTKPRRPTGRR